MSQKVLKDKEIKAKIQNDFTIFIIVKKIYYNKIIL